MVNSLLPPKLDLGDIELRPLSLEDRCDMYAYASNPTVARYVTWNIHHSPTDSENFISSVISDYEQGIYPVWGIELKSTGVLIGTCALHHWSQFNETAELGYALSKNFWGRGITTRVAKSVTSFAFEYMNLNRIYALCHIENHRSARVLEKIGMVKEGTLRDYYKVKGEFWTVWLYAILHREHTEINSEDNYEWIWR